MSDKGIHIFPEMVGHIHGDKLDAVGLIEALRTENNGLKIKIDEELKLTDEAMQYLRNEIKERDEKIYMLEQQVLNLRTQLAEAMNGQR